MSMILILRRWGTPGRLAVQGQSVPPHLVSTFWNKFFFREIRNITKNPLSHSLLPSLTVVWTENSAGLTAQVTLFHSWSALLLWCCPEVVRCEWMFCQNRTTSEGGKRETPELLNSLGRHVSNDMSSLYKASPLRGHITTLGTRSFIQDPSKLKHHVYIAVFAKCIFQGTHYQETVLLMRNFTCWVFTPLLLPAPSWKWYLHSDILLID